jgi:Fe2+ or Zn2+ uptake regulation protein
MPIYKNKLTDFQVNTLNLIENFDIRKSLMSIFSYMLIINTRKNELYGEYQIKLLEKDPDKLKVSFGELHRLYTRNHQKISLQTIKNRIEKLVELKLLIVVSKTKKTNVYKFVYEKSEIISNNVSNNENFTCEVDPIFDSNLQEDKYINSKSNKDLDSNNSTEFDYENYVTVERKVCDWSMVCSKFDEICKALKIKNSWIKERVCSKLQKYYYTITVKHLESYIVKMISNARTEYHRSYEINAKNKKLCFNNFEGRNYSANDYAFMEKRLLGWE